MTAWWALFRRDVALAFGPGGGAGLGVAFFLIAAALFPFGVGAKPEILSPIAPGVIWVCALLAALLTLDRLFQADMEDGSLDLIAAGPLMLEAAALAKIAAHWVAACGPLIAATPLIAIMLNLPFAALPDLMLSLLIGTPALSLIGAIGAALTAGLRRGGLLTAVLAAPLYIPTLIIGALAARAALEGLETGPLLAMLGAVTALSAAISPIAAAAALRLNLS